MLTPIANRKWSAQEQAHELATHVSAVSAFKAVEVKQNAQLLETFVRTRESRRADVFHGCSWTRSIWALNSA